MVSALWPLLTAMTLTAEFWFAIASLALIGALWWLHVWWRTGNNTRLVHPHHCTGALPFRGGGDGDECILRIPNWKLGWNVYTVVFMVCGTGRTDRSARHMGLCQLYPNPDGQIRNMKIDLSQPEPIVDSIDLARVFNLSPEQVKKLMRAGDITSRFETGVGEDAGTHRLTFWHDQTKVRFTCDAAGNVLKTARINTAKRP